MGSSLIITLIGVLLLLAALAVTIWQLYKYYRSRRSRSTTSSLLEAGHRRDSSLPQSPVHSGFQPLNSDTRTHIRNKSESFGQLPGEKPLPDPEIEKDVLAERVARDYGWRWSLFGRHEDVPPTPIAKDHDPNYEVIGLAH